MWFTISGWFGRCDEQLLQQDSWSDEAAEGAARPGSLSLASQTQHNVQFLPLAISSFLYGTMALNFPMNNFFHFINSRKDLVNSSLFLTRSVTTYSKII